MTNHDAQFHEKYDPDLHGTLIEDQEAPAAQRGLAFAITVLLIALPVFAYWYILS